MNTDDNKQTTTEMLLSYLKQQIDCLENKMAERCGMKLYKSVEGFPLFRKPKVLEIPFESGGNSDYISFMYRAFCHLINYGIELTPEEHNKYLACKIVLEREKLTEKEEIFDENGAIVNQEVGYFWQRSLAHC